jgi:RNA polymerase sigma-70 factor (ECF subfamily)
VGKVRPERQDQQQPQAQTLGDLLYSNKAAARVSEHEWVLLLESVAAGNQLALHSIYERTHRIVFTLVLRITGNQETAEEVTLDVFHDIWRRASAYEPSGGSVVGWIMNQARSRAIDRVRFEQRKKRLNNSGDDPPSSPAPRDPHQTVELVEEVHLLQLALNTLTPEERQVIETAFFSELTYPEVAKQLNQPLGTVKTRIRSGLAKLRGLLGKTLRAL